MCRAAERRAIVLNRRRATRAAAIINCRHRSHAPRSQHIGRLHPINSFAAFVHCHPCVVIVLSSIRSPIRSSWAEEEDRCFETISAGLPHLFGNDFWQTVYRDF